MHADRTRTLNILFRAGHRVMYSKNNLQWRRISGVRRSIDSTVTIRSCRFVRRKYRRALALVASFGLSAALLPQIHGAPLMEESFNYPAASTLATDSPWLGTANTGLVVTAGSLSVTNLRSIDPAGNNLQVTSGATASAHRNFSTTTVSNNAVYCSFLLNCSTLPTNSQFTLALLRSGATGASPPDDPLDLYLRPLGGGYSFTLTSAGSDPSSANKILTANTTHLIVVKYTFGTLGLGSLFIDPIPGGTEPASPDINAASDDNIGAANLQVILIRSIAGQGVWNFDTLRAGTNWSDVTPLVVPLFLDGPQDQAVCFGNPANFTVTPNGTPPYFYQWRTNGTSIPGATNSTYPLSSPGPSDALNTYDVLVQDGFGTATSRVASLTLSTVPASIASPPQAQVVLPSSTNAVFTVTAGGDAPLSYQWRADGIAIPDATNNICNITNPTSASPSVQYDVIVTNPCGAVTSSPPVSLLFPSVFYSVFDAGPGFFSGENLVLTNSGGLTLQAWSSDSLSLPITQWNLEGPLQEQPLNDGTGKSFYSINVTPATSPTYYIFGASVSPPYLSPIPILNVTLDSNGFYILANSEMPVSSNGTLGFPPAQISIVLQPDGTLNLIGAGTPVTTYLLQATTNFQPPIQWLTIQTNTAGTNGLVLFSDTNSLLPLRFYRLLAQ